MISNIKPTIKKKMIAELTKRYGIPKSAFKKFAFVESEHYIYACSKSMDRDMAAKLNPDRIGLKAVNKDGFMIETDFAQLLDEYITKNVLQVDSETAKQFVQGFVINDADFSKLEQGQVIVKYGDYVLGRGYYNGKRVVCHIATARRLKKIEI